MAFTLRQSVSPDIQRLGGDLKQEQAASPAARTAFYIDTVRIPGGRLITQHMQVKSACTTSDKPSFAFVPVFAQCRTPNPDVSCNRFIKFDAFTKHATGRLGADLVATGEPIGIYASLVLTTLETRSQRFAEILGVSSFRQVDTR